jgi:hypothetical protein
VSEGRKTLLESEPGSISLAREAPGNLGISDVPAAAADPILGKKIFYGPSYGIIQIIQNIQGFRFCSKNIYFSKTKYLVCLPILLTLLPFLLK